MKISQDLKSQTIPQVRTNTTGKQSFDTMVQSQSHKLQREELKQIINEITKQGDKLAHTRSFRDLANFKRLVKGFLEETVYNGLDLEKSYSFRYDGQNQELSIVKEVDEKLIELTEEVMNQEKKAVDLLGIIGEIKGLLINLYM